MFYNLLKQELSRCPKEAFRAAFCTELPFLQHTANVTVQELAVFARALFFIHNKALVQEIKAVFH